MNDHKYILEPYKGINTKHRYPGCEKNRVFTRYIDSETLNHLSDTVGRCDREVNCGYHLKPKQFFINSGTAHGSFYSDTRARESRNKKYVDKGNKPYF